MVKKKKNTVVLHRTKLVVEMTVGHMDGDTFVADQPTRTANSYTSEAVIDSNNGPLKFIAVEPDSTDAEVDRG